MSYRGTDNLRCYVREAVLPEMLNGQAAPPMPIHGHKSHLNTLTVRPEFYRKLETIYRFRDQMIEEMIAAWIDTHVPDAPLSEDDEDEVTGERLSVPCPAIFSIPQQRLTRPSDIHRLSPWLDNLPFQTVQRVLHLIFPHTSHWSFQLDDEKDPDDSIFKHFLWTVPSAAEPADLQIMSRSVVLAFQPPWVLAPFDLQKFADCSSFPACDGRYPPPPLKSKERLWGKLWDTCIRKRCPWFVLSTYSGWCFGVFTRGWTMAFVSSVYSYNDQSPSIIEILIFWLISAMGLPGGWKIPEVAEPVVNFAAGFSIPPSHDDRFANAPSESSWDGKSDETGTSAGLKRPLSPDVSELGLPNKRYIVSARTRMRPDVRRRVYKWVRNVERPVASPPRHRSPTPALSEVSWSSGSDSTVVALDRQNRHYGDWLILPKAGEEI